MPAAREPFALHDAQSVIAREYGFESFAKLTGHVESSAVRTLMAAHPNAPLPETVIEALFRATSAKPKMPSPLTSATSLPLVPLRGALITAGSVAPINVGRASSIAAVEAARTTEGLLAVFSQKDAATEDPTVGDLHRVGCVVEILDVQSAGYALSPASTYLVLRGTQWVTLDTLETTASFSVARVAPFVVTKGDPAEATRLETLLRAKVEPIVATLPGGDRIRAQLAQMSGAELADATIANLPCSVDVKAQYASEPTDVARLSRALSLLNGA